MELNCEEDTAVVGVIKQEEVVPECAYEAVCPIVIQPVVTADESQQHSARRQSARTTKKRSLLLPGELENDVSTRISKYCPILPHPEPAENNLGVGDENTDDFTVSEVFEVTPGALPPKKKRTYCRRRKPKEPSTGKNRPADSQNSSESVSELLGQLVNAYCGDDGHPANCEECNTRVEMIRALLESSGRCRQDASASDPAADFSVSAVSQEASNTEAARVGLFSCAKCPDRFDTFDELQNHEKMHSAGRKKCDVCHQYLAAGTSLALVSKQFHCLLQKYACSSVLRC